MRVECVETVKKADFARQENSQSAPGKYKIQSALTKRWCALHFVTLMLRSKHYLFGMCLPASSNTELIIMDSGKKTLPEKNLSLYDLPQECLSLCCTGREERSIRGLLNYYHQKYYNNDKRSFVTGCQES